MRIEKGNKLLFIGDSITDAGRTKPIGEGIADALGKGYVAQVDALLGAAQPGHPIRIVNMGTSGNTVRDLARRWQTDVIDLKPDWLSIMIGINDVWRQFDRPRQRDAHVYPDEYESTLRDLVQRTRPGLKGLVLMTPYYIELSRSDAMRARMDQYGQIVKKIGGENDAIVVDTQAAFDAVLSTYYPATLAWDRVHPNHTGNMVIALSFLKAIGFTL